MWSPPNGHSVFSWIGAALKYAGLQVDANGLIAAHQAAAVVERMSTGTQRSPYGGLNAGFNREAVFEVPHTRHVACFLNVHPEVHDVGHDLCMRLGLIVRSHHSEGHEGLPVAHQESGDEGVRRPLARREPVGMAGLQRKCTAA